MKLNEWLYSFSGGDYRIITECDAEIQRQFLKTGLFVPLLFILCFISAAFSFSHVFSNHFVSVIIALFFSWMVTNIYRLMLYTLARNSLPVISTTRSAITSTSIRVMFICFISLFVLKPLESILYSKALDADIESYKANIMHVNEVNLAGYYQQQIDEVKRLSFDESYFRNFLHEKTREQKYVIHNMKQLVNSSDYYLQRIIFLNTKHLSCWLITLVFMVAFNLPVYYLRRMKDNAYYAMKTAMEMQMVNEAYNIFKTDFAETFKDKYNKKVSYCELYVDAPYNIIKKEDTEHYLNQEHLLTELYDA